MDGVEVHYLNKYERAHLIGIRILQLEGGQFPVSRDMENKSIPEIAEQDIRSGKLRMHFERPHHELWSLCGDFQCKFLRKLNQETDI